MLSMKTSCLLTCLLSSLLPCSCQEGSDSWELCHHGKGISYHGGSCVFMLWIQGAAYVWLFITKNFKCALQYCSSQLKCAFMNLTRTFGTVGFPDEVQTNTPFQWQYIRTDEQLPRLSATRNCELECSTRTKEFYLDSHQLQQPGSKAATPQVEWQIGLLFSVTLWLDGNLRLHRWSSCYYYRGRRANDCSMCVIFDLAGGQLIGKVSLNYCCCTIGET